MNHDLPRQVRPAGAATATMVDAGISFRGLTIGEREARSLSEYELVCRLVDAGASRLTAERIVAIERGDDEAGRARRHVRGR